MSANIETSADGRAAFVNAGDRNGPAWHGLGTEVEVALTAEEAGKLAHLTGWNVRKAPLFGQREDRKGLSGRTLAVPRKVATVRDNPFTEIPEVIGVVGENYQIVQNEEAFAMADAIVDEGGAHFHTAGSLGPKDEDGVARGNRVFMSLKLPEGILVGGEDAHDLYLVIVNSLDGTSALKAMVTLVRVVCQNTLRMAERQAKASWSLRHTGDMTGKIQVAREALNLTWEHADAFGKEAERLLSQPYSEANFNKLTKILVPEPKSDKAGYKARTTERRDVLTSLFVEADTNAFGRGTKWGAFNAVAEFADWYRSDSESRGLESLGLQRDILKNKALQVLSVR